MNLRAGASRQHNINKRDSVSTTHLWYESARGAPMARRSAPKDALCALVSRGPPPLSLGLSSEYDRFMRRAFSYAAMTGKPVLIVNISVTDAEAEDVFNDLQKARDRSLSPPPPHT